MVGFEESIFWQVCYNCGEFHELWWVLNMVHYNCGDFHELWWVLKKDSIFWHVIIVVILMNCGGF